MGYFHSLLATCNDIHSTLPGPLLTIQFTQQFSVAITCYKYPYQYILRANGHVICQECASIVSFQTAIYNFNKGCHPSTYLPQSSLLYLSHVSQGTMFITCTYHTVHVNYGKQSLYCCGTTIWNSLPTSITETLALNQFICQ